MLNYLAAPFGSEEYMVSKFGVKDVDYTFNDKFEPTDRMRGENIADVKARASSQFVNNIMFQIGLSFWLPTSFEYTTFR